MKIHIYLTLTLITLIITNCKDNNSAPELKRISYQSDVTQTERDYFLYIPEGYKESKKPFPVLLFLHGNGERGNGKDELDFVLKHGPLYEAWIQKRNLPFIMIVPQLPMFGMGEVSYIKNRKRDEIPTKFEDSIPQRPEKWQMDFPMVGTLSDTLLPINIEGLPEGWPLIEKELLGMLDFVHKNYNTDKSKVYLTGLSYGGFGTWYMASKNPKTFAAIAPIVGYAHPDLMQPIAENKIPVWCVAGGRDMVVQVKYFYPALNKLEALGHKNIRFTIEADMGHDVWVRTYGGDDLYNWFLGYSLTQITQ